jgi:hypothetical protein
MVLAVAVDFVGCASHSPIGIYPKTVLNPYEVVVFGRVDAYMDGQPMKWSNSMLKDEGTFELIVRHRTNRQDFGYCVQPDGYFFWRLMPGDYVLKEFQFKYMLKGYLWGYFDVANERTILYVGTLHIDFTRGTPVYRMKMEDDFAAACDALKERCPQIQGKPERSLMRLGRKSKMEQN